jgi:branched-chain amino acid transport system substrate-binding protein
LGHLGIYVRQASFSNTFQGKVLADFAVKELKAKRALIVVAADCAYCETLADAFAHSLEDGGGTVVKRVSLLSQEQDVGSHFDSLDPKTFDVVMIPDHEVTSERIISALVKRGIQQPFLGGDGWRNLANKPFGTENQFKAYMVTHWHPTLRTVRNQKFIRDYRSRYGKSPTDSAALAYDSFYLIAKALMTLNRFDRQSLAKAMSKIRVFDGVTGHFVYPAGQGAPLKTALLLKEGKNGFEIMRMINPDPEKIVVETSLQ